MYFIQIFKTHVKCIVKISGTTICENTKANPSNDSMKYSNIRLPGVANKYLVKKLFEPNGPNLICYRVLNELANRIG